MPDPATSATPLHPDAAPPPPVPAARPAQPLWRKILLIAAFTAAGLRLLLLLHVRAHPPATLPTFPLPAGDVFTFTPGDANIAKWGQNLDTDGFLVQLISAPASPGPAQPPAAPRFCALQPDYMADAQQPGGTLTLLSQQPTGDWRVRWSGGNTLAPYSRQKGDVDANCGTNSVLQMSEPQLHSLRDILAGISASAPAK
jgi:hypothetical protein